MSDSDPPNIVLVTVDSLRADHCGFMGYERDTTPRLDTLTEDGVVYENAVVPAPYTEESMPAILTGEFVSHARETNDEHVAKRRYLPERLADRGYATAGFTPNPFTSRNFGFSRGFDTFHDFFDSDDRSTAVETFLSRVAQGDLVEAIRLGANTAGFNVPGIGNQSIPFRAYEDMVLDWVDAASEPFFCWIFLLEVHSPYRPTPEYRAVSLPQMLYLNLIRSHLVDRDPTPAETAQLVALYDGAIQLTDETIATLRSDLEAYDPVFVIHSDHGESFGEHDNFGHNDHLYEENLHVPLVVTDAEASGRVSEPISLRAIPDIVESIAEDGTFDPGEFTRDRVLARAGSEKIAVSDETTKFILNRDGRSEWYDLVADPEETEPRQRSDRDALRRIRAQLATESEKARISRCASSREEWE